MSPRKTDTCRTHTYHRAVRLGFLMAALVVLFNPVSGPADSMVSELQAEFIGRFPQFIEWPPSTLIVWPVT